MNAQQRANLLHSIDYATTHLRRIATSGRDLQAKRQDSDMQMVMLLEDVIDLLPPDMRKALEACLGMYDRVWYDLPLDPPIALAFSPVQHSTPLSHETQHSGSLLQLPH